MKLSISFLHFLLIYIQEVSWCKTWTQSVFDQRGTIFPFATPPKLLKWNLTKIYHILDHVCHCTPILHFYINDFWGFMIQIYIHMKNGMQCASISKLCSQYFSFVFLGGVHMIVINETINGKITFYLIVYYPDFKKFNYYTSPYWFMFNLGKKNLKMLV